MNDRNLGRRGGVVYTLLVCLIRPIQPNTVLVPGTNLEPSEHNGTS
jgi:hypothetical protein